MTCDVRRVVTCKDKHHLYVALQSGDKNSIQKRMSHVLTMLCVMCNDVTILPFMNISSMIQKLSTSLSLSLCLYLGTLKKSKYENMTIYDVTCLLL